jgi:hypothetical protein
MHDEPRITDEEIQALPRWARLAFAVRCVRRAAALLRAPAAHAEGIDRALALAEQAARLGRADDALADAAAAAYRLALDTIDPGGHVPAVPLADDDAVIVTCTVAHAAAFAAEAATLPAARMAAYLLAQSVGFAAQAHVAARPDLAAQATRDMRRDLQRLQEAAQREGWNDQTPLGDDFFGPL